MRARLAGVLSCFLAAAVLHGCGGGEDPMEPDGGGPSVSLEPGQVTLTAIGETRDFAANLVGPGGEDRPDGDGSWSAADTTIASVDEEGVVTARATGSTDVVVRFEGVADTASVEVDPQTADVTVSPARDSVAGNGGQRQLSAQTVDRNGNPVSGVQVEWSSSDTTAAVVDRSGLVTGRLNLGEVGIVAAADGVADTAEIVVFDPPGNQPPRVSITEPGDFSNQALEQSIRFDGTATDVEDGELSGSVLVWTSSIDGQFGTGVPLDTDQLSRGEHTIVLEATDSGGAADADTIRIDVVEGVNLSLERFVISARGVLQSEQVDVGAVIRNNGVLAAGGFDWELRVDGSVQATGRIDTLAAGDTVRIPEQTGLGPFSPGRHDLRLEIDPADEVDEFDETGDNVLEDRIHSYSQGFGIELDFVTEVDSTIEEAFDRAEARWENIIQADLPDVPFSQPQDFEFCAEGAGQRDTPVDDMLIFVRVDSIDGPSNVLGRAGPCFVRQTTGGAVVTTIVGGMVFDEADLERLSTGGQLEATILHEMGHVMGIGTLWPLQGLLEGEGSTNPTYTGTAGREGFEQVGGDAGDPVPVANTGGQGTRDSHWRESVFGNELMTGFLNSGDDPLSIVSVASLRDQFLPVDESAADEYQLPTGGALRAPGSAVHFGDDLLRAPLYGVRPDGIVRPIDRRQLRRTQ